MTVPDEPHGAGRSPDEGARGPDVAQRIRALVRRHELRPGDVLPTEAELSRLLRASRSSVREAIRTLVALDQVEVRHGHGTYVGRMGLAPLTGMLVTRAELAARPDADPVVELLQVLHAVESDLADTLCSGHDAQSRDRLSELAAAIRQTAGSGLPVDRLTARFHTLLVSPALPVLAGQVAVALWDAAVQLSPHGAGGRDGPAFPGARLGVVAEVHEALAAAVTAGDAPALRGALRRYLLGGD